jgi:alcohol dehydrogenase, propanol-preferring
MKAVRILRAKESLKNLEADMRFLGRRARLALVGLFGGEMKLNLISMPTRAYKIIGIDNGSIIDLIELISLVKRSDQTGSFKSI